MAVHSSLLSSKRCRQPAVFRPDHMASSSSSLSLESMSLEERIAIVRRHFEAKGYRVHSGLQFGCELVLYADDPTRVHSDFCVHLVQQDGRLDWRTMQTLVRSMPDLHKTLILAHIRQGTNGELIVDEMAIATEHAPFRHKRQETIQHVGAQVKKKARTDDNDDLNDKDDPGNVYKEGE